MGFNSAFKELRIFKTDFQANKLLATEVKFMSSVMRARREASQMGTIIFLISFIYTLSPLWDYQYKYDIVHITLSVQT